MANNYIENFTEVANWGKPFQRGSRFPLDRSSMFDSYVDAEKYVKGDGSDKRNLGAGAYIGQIIAVYENNKVSVYCIDAEGETGRKLSPIGGTDTIVENSYAAALTASEDAKVGQLIRITQESKYPVEPAEGVKQETYKPGFYIVDAPGFISSLSTSTGSDDEIGALQSALNTLAGRVETAETKITALYSGDEVNVYLKSDIDDKLDKKVSSETYAEDKTTLENSIAEKLAASWVTETYNVDKETLDKNIKSLQDNKLDSATAETTYAKIATVSSMQTTLNGKAETAWVETNYTNTSTLTGLLNAKADATYVDSEVSAVSDKVYDYSIEKSSDSDLVYTLYKTKVFLAEGEEATKTTVGTINIPKDLMVTSGEVVVNPEGQEAGTYIKLVIGTDEKTVYVPANSLIDVYTSNSKYLTIENYNVEFDYSTLVTDLKTSGLLDGLATEAKAQELATTAESNAKTHAETKAAAAQTAAEAKAQELANTAQSNAEAKAQELANTAQSNAQSYTDTNFVKLADYNTKMQALDGIDQGFVQRFTDLENMVGGGTQIEGGQSIVTVVGNHTSQIQSINTTIGAEADGENPATGLIGDIRDLEANYVKAVQIGIDVIQPSENIVAINVESEITASSSATALVNVAAINTVVSELSTDIETAKADSVNVVVIDKTDLPEVATAKTDVIYITTDEYGKHSEVIAINGNYYQLGADSFVKPSDLVTIATKDIIEEIEGVQVTKTILDVENSKDGLMTAEDKYKLDNIGAISNDALALILV